MKFPHIVSGLMLVGVSLGFTAVASAQTLPTCRATARVCNDVAGLGRHAPDRFDDEFVSPAAAALPACTAADQPSTADCDAVLRRHNARRRRVATVPVGANEEVLVVGEQRPTPAPSGRDRTARRGLVELRPIAVTAYNNTLALNTNLGVERAERVAGDQQLLANQQQLANQQAATRQRVDDLGWQLSVARSETRWRFFTPFRYTWQHGGDITVAGAGVGLGVTHWGQGSSLALDASVSWNFIAHQPYAPGVAPLQSAWGTIGMAIGRGPLQGLINLQIGLATRFGDANQGEATGATEADAGLGGGLRFETPLRPVTRPNGASFYAEAQGHLGLGLTNVVIAGQPPLRSGFMASGHLAVGFAL